MRRKKSQIVVKETEPKEKAKGSTESGEKIKLLRSPHMIHLSLIRILRSSIVIISNNYQNEVKWRQLKTQNIL